MVDSRQYLLYADEDLMSLLEAGDAEAFAALYDRHGRAAYSLSYRMMGEKQAAEDLAQDAFLKVWRSAGGHRPARARVRDRGPAPAPLPQGLASGGRLQARARQRAHLDPLHRPQPRHRPAPLAGEPPEDPAEDPGRGPQAPPAPAPP